MSFLFINCNFSFLSHFSLVPFWEIKLQLLLEICFSVNFMEEKEDSRVLALSPKEIPIIDFTHLLSQNPQTRSSEVEKIHLACQKNRIFQIVNHDVCKTVIEDAFESSIKFFELPIEEKKMFMSDDIHKPIRFGILRDNVFRDFIKLYANPIEDWIHLWPENPTDFKKKMANYATEVRRLGINVIGAIMESLGLSANYLRDKLEQGNQMIVANNYPQISPFANSMGQQCHADHSIITVLAENTTGALEIIDFEDNTWKVVSALEGALIVIVGNHLEVISNGLYKSVFHRVALSSQSPRVSIASLQCLCMEDMVEPAIELIDEQNPERYRATSLAEFINHLSSKEAKLYIDILKI